MYKAKLYILEDEVELFKDESLNVNSSVQNIDDITKVFTDFNRGFTVPASDSNNKIFKHWWNVDITGGFDARIKVQATIELSFLPFKRGFIKLNDIVMFNNKPKHYVLQYFGLLTSLTDTFKDDFLNEIDLSALNHTYDFTNVNTGVSTGLSGGSIIYPLISSKKRWYYSSNLADDTNTETLVNIAYEAATDKGIKWSELKPAVLVTDLIDAIETKYGIVFSTDFIGTTTFDSLYMWLSREKGELRNMTSGNERLINWTGETGTTDFIDIATDRFSEVTSWEVDGGEVDETYYTYSLTVTPTVLTVEYSIIARDLEKGDDIVASKSNVIGVQTLSGQVHSDTINNGDQLFDIGFYISSGETIAYTVTVDITETFQTFGNPDVDTLDDYTAASDSITGTLVISNFIPKIKVIDFINGIIKMNNLAVVPTSSTDLFTDTLDDWYDAGNNYEVSRFIDYTKEYPINRIPLPSALNFNFKEPKTFLAKQFQEMNNTTYGDLELILDDGSGNVFDGSPLNFELPFEQMIYERLTDDNDNTLSDLQIGYAVDDKEEAVLTSPHLFYAINQSVVGKTFALLNDSGTPTEKTTAFMPFHGNTQTNPTYSTLWGADLNEWDGVGITNSLYNLRYKNYITDLFSAKRRKYKFEAIFPLGLMTVLKLNDKLIINNVAYIINNIDSNLTNGKVKLELLNYIGVLTGDVTNIFFEYDFGSTQSGIVITDDSTPITGEEEVINFEYEI